MNGFMRSQVLKNRSGATIPIVAVSLAMLVGCAAIAIDIAMLLDSRAEAQRAADSAALAGASALLDLKAEPQNVQEAAAEARAVQFAVVNSVRNEPVAPEDVTVDFPTTGRIAATVSKGEIPPMFAGIFGFSSFQVAATAHAIYFQGSTASCLKPFGVPDRDPFSEANIHDEVLVWQKSADGDYPLIKHLVVPNVRTSIESQECDAGRVSVGDLLELQSGTASMAGQVEKGLEYLRGLDTTIEWDPALYGHLGYNGFNRADWQNSSRVINVVTYEYPNTYGETRFKVTGFLTVFLNRHEEVQVGNDLLQYGIILPTKAVGGPCTPPACSPTTWGIRLVQ
jgi:hypothetical protein